MNDPTLFQYCQKLVVFRANDTQVLLAQRKGEADYNATYSFIGGKLEVSDAGILDGLQREKDEEIGSAVKLKVFYTYSYNEYFIKSNGSHVILPHYYAQYLEGEVLLSDEYADYIWVAVSELTKFEPKIENIPHVVTQLLRLKAVLAEEDTVII